MKTEMVREIVLMTGLEFETVVNLLKNGWAYTQEMNKPLRWEKQ